jgi:hypothetical protein
MLFKASHFATALSAVIAEYHRPGDCRFVGACANFNSSTSIDLAEQGSIRKPE